MAKKKKTIFRYTFLSLQNPFNVIKLQQPHVSRHQRDFSLQFNHISLRVAVYVGGLVCVTNLCKTVQTLPNESYTVRWKVTSKRREGASLGFHLFMHIF